jgi:hypothetical protein
MINECGAFSRMRIGRGNWSTQRKPTPSTTLSTTNPVWPDLGLNPWSLQWVLTAWSVAWSSLPFWLKFVTGVNPPSPFSNTWLQAICCWGWELEPVTGLPSNQLYHRFMCGLNLWWHTYVAKIEVKIRHVAVTAGFMCHFHVYYGERMLPSSFFVSLLIACEEDDWMLNFSILLHWFEFSIVG